jgi:hypothetical protein
LSCGFRHCSNEVGQGVARRKVLLVSLDPKKPL